MGLGPRGGVGGGTLAVGPVSWTSPQAAWGPLPGQGKRMVEVRSQVALWVPLGERLAHQMPA